MLFTFGVCVIHVARLKDDMSECHSICDLLQWPIWCDPVVHMLISDKLGQDMLHWQLGSVFILLYTV